MKSAYFLFCTSVFLSQTMLAAPIPCEKWENGKCLQGPLTKLAKALGMRQFANSKEASPICKKICTDACPKCEYCEYYDLCDFYQEKACMGLSYYVDKNTCAEKKTNSCCDLCQSQCETKGGACANGGICEDGDASSSTQIYCLEKSGQKCERCAPKTGE